jgi:hypothetical protein
MNDGAIPDGGIDQTMNDAETRCGGAPAAAELGRCRQQQDSEQSRSRSPAARSRSATPFHYGAALFFFALARM